MISNAAFSCKNLITNVANEFFAVNFALFEMCGWNVHVETILIGRYVSTQFTFIFNVVVLITMPVQLSCIPIMIRTMCAAKKNHKTNWIWNRMQIFNVISLPIFQMREMFSSNMSIQSEFTSMLRIAIKTWNVYRQQLCHVHRSNMNIEIMRSLK